VLLVQQVEASTACNRSPHTRDGSAGAGKQTITLVGSATWARRGDWMSTTKPVQGIPVQVKEPLVPNSRNGIRTSRGRIGLAVPTGG